MPRDIDAMSTRKKRAEGAILISSILIVLGISLATAALLRIAARDTAFGMLDEKRAGVFGLAESCLDDSAAWLRSAVNPEGALPHVIEKNAEDISHGEESALQRAKLSGYSMRCEINGSPATGAPVALSDLHPSDEGEMAQDQGGYGLSGDLSPKIYYWAESKGEGSDDADRNVGAIISVRY